jgi:hypothetical protein
MDHEPVSTDLKLMLCGHSDAQRLDFFRMKLDQLLAFLAVQVIVLGIAVIMFVHRPATDIELPQQSGGDQLVECAIDGRAAYANLGLAMGDRFDKFVRFEVVVALVDLLDHEFALLRQSFTTTVEEFSKSLQWRERHVHRAERKVVLCVSQGRVFLRGQQIPTPQQEAIAHEKWGRGPRSPLDGLS